MDILSGFGTLLEDAGGRPVRLVGVLFVPICGAPDVGLEGGLMPIDESASVGVELEVLLRIGLVAAAAVFKRHRWCQIPLGALTMEGCMLSTVAPGSRELVVRVTMTVSRASVVVEDVVVVADELA